VVRPLASLVDLTDQPYPDAAPRFIAKSRFGTLER
jgi:hypothetical protein